MLRNVSLLVCLLCPAAFPAVVSQDGAAWIQDAGGSFQKNAAGHIVEVDLTSTWVTDDDLAKLATLSELRKLNLSYTRITDLGLEHLRPLRNVTYLNCYYCEYVTDGGIAFLKQWVNLEYLNVRGTEVTSRAFELLANMKKLKTLDVGCSRVNDDGFDALASLDTLEELHIGGDKMTGRALPLLRLLPSLKRLDLNGSQAHRFRPLGPDAHRRQHREPGRPDAARSPEYGRRLGDRRGYESALAAGAS